ncbi:MAG: N-acetyl-gamma-glutamyl-phosphate reductase [Chloroflexi bacterium]|nr:N-acetyl-gamma-glutamyl-phosphate reductase [Chloroflexota bacterium]
MLRVSIVGASGYTGGELLRLVLDHPQLQVHQVTSRRYVGQYVYQIHPNLRKRTRLKFTTPEALEPVDVLFLALPHGEAQKNIERWAELATYIVDLSADFRLRDPAAYERWYGQPHAAPAWLSKFVYGLPELHRQDLRGARFISGVGCNATATILALWPALQAGLVDTQRPIIADIKVGSSEGGASPNPGSHHPERANVVRTYAPFGHRHTAEVMQELGLTDVHLTMTSVDMVRGAMATVHAWTHPGVTEKDLWRAYRQAVNENPFLRLVKERRGIYRVPDPKILAGSNYADLGFALDEAHGHLVAMAAIDNLMKGAAGSALQSLNVALGWEETLGLTFPGLHPI